MGDYVREKARELDRVREAEARGEKNPRRTSEDVRAEYEIERRQEKMRELRARIRELEAECKMHCQAAQDLVVECDRWRKRAEKAEAENARLREADARVTEAFAGLIERDPHQYSKRPCQTCTAATGLLGRDFGCVAKAKRGTHG